MTVETVGWVWIATRWHLALRAGSAICGARFRYRLHGPATAPRCPRCERYAERRGIEL